MSANATFPTGQRTGLAQGFRQSAAPRERRWWRTPPLVDQRPDLAGHRQRHGCWRRLMSEAAEAAGHLQ